MSLLLRIQFAHLALTGQMHDKESQPFQNIALLVKLRNLLVHTRPEEVTIGEEVEGKKFPTIVGQFISLGLISKPTLGAPLAWAAVYTGAQSCGLGT